MLIYESIFKRNIEVCWGAGECLSYGCCEVTSFGVRVLVRGIWWQVVWWVGLYVLGMEVMVAGRGKRDRVRRGIRGIRGKMRMRGRK